METSGMAGEGRGVGSGMVSVGGDSWVRRRFLGQARPATTFFLFVEAPAPIPWTPEEEEAFSELERLSRGRRRGST